MDNLVVNNELLVAIVDDQDTDGSGTLAVGSLDLGAERALVDDWDNLDLTSVGDDDEVGVVTDVKEAVLLESWGDQGVQDNGWRWVGDNAQLLDQLLGEEVNTEVPVLTGLGGGGDADDLAWALLEDDQVTNADVVAWDGEGSVRWGSGGSWSSWGGWLWWSGLLGWDGSDELDLGWLTGKGVSLAGLGVVRLEILAWVDGGIQLGTEVLQVVVVMIGRHFLFFLFLLFDDDDLWNSATRLLGDVYVDLFDVSGLRVVFGGDVDLWS